MCRSVVGSVDEGCWGTPSVHAVQILRLPVGPQCGTERGMWFPHAWLGAVSMCRCGLVDQGCGGLVPCASRCPSARRAATKKKLPVLPSPADPCSLACKSASRFLRHLLKGLLQSVVWYNHLQ